MSKGNILISVTDKTGLEKFKPLYDAGWQIISTGGTAGALLGHGISSIGIEAITGFPEMMDGRLKTLHPKIHGGILADRSKPEHLESAKVHGIPLIDVVVVNLYKFNAKPSIETIDIGGPALIRGAAKNCASVAVVVDPSDYDELIKQLTDPAGTTLAYREYLAQEAFKHTTWYDGSIFEWIDAKRYNRRSINKN